MSRKKTDTTTKRASSPQVEAGPCQRVESHSNTEVYRTKGRTRYCKCNDCGHTWKLSGPYADPLREYAVTLSDTLSKAPRSEGFVTLTDELAKEIATDLREFAK